MLDGDHWLGTFFRQLQLIILLWPGDSERMPLSVPLDLQLQLHNSSINVYFTEDAEIELLYTYSELCTSYKNLKLIAT